MPAFELVEENRRQQEAERLMSADKKAWRAGASSAVAADGFVEIAHHPKRTVQPDAAGAAEAATNATGADSSSTAPSTSPAYRIRPWSITRGPEQWTDLWKRLGMADSADAIAVIAAFSQGGAFVMLSSRVASPAREWAAKVKRGIEVEESRPCFSPGDDNLTVTHLTEEEADEDEWDRWLLGRWLLIFVWCAKAAATSGGRMVQLVVPGLGLSPMQKAEEELAEVMGLRIERRHLDREESKAHGLLVNWSGDPSSRGLDPALLTAPGEPPAEREETESERERREELEDDARAAERIRDAVDALNSLVLTKQEAGTLGKVEAVGVLLSLAIKAEHRVAIAEAGGIPPLIILLKEGTMLDKEHAACALWSLAGNNADNKALIAEFGAIEPLVALVGEGSTSAKEHAATALRNLAGGSTENKKAIIAAGAIPPLVAMLADGASTDIGKEKAAVALHNLSNTNASKLAIGRAGAIPLLVDLVSTGTPMGKEHAAGTLWSLSANDANEVAIVEAGAIPPLVRLAKKGTSGARKKAAKALNNLSFAPGHREQILSAGYHLPSS